MLSIRSLFEAIICFICFSYNGNLAWAEIPPSKGVIRFSIHEQHAPLLRSGSAQHENGVLTKFLSKLSQESGYLFVPIWRYGDATGESDIQAGKVDFIIDPPTELLDKTNPELISTTLLNGYHAVIRLANAKETQDKLGYLQSTGKKSIETNVLASGKLVQIQNFSDIHRSLIKNQIDGAILPLRLAQYYLIQHGLEELIIIDRLLGNEPFKYKWVFHPNLINLKNELDQITSSWSKHDIAKTLNISPQSEKFENASTYNEYLYLVLFSITAILMLLWIWRLKCLNASNHDRESNLVKSNHEAIKANSAKSNLLATVSHEIRTPMHAVLGVQELLLKSSSLKKEEKSLLLSAQHCASSLLEMLDQVLNLSKIEAGKSPIKMQASNLRDLINHYSMPFIEMAKKKGIQCEIQLDTAIAESLLIDAGIIRQILQNLISNAVKFTSSGSIRITGQVLNNTFAEQMIQITIADTGIGMAKNEIVRAIKPFEQIHNPKINIISGTGLGLSIAKELLKSLSSELILESYPGLGTTASFTLNLSRSSAKPKAIIHSELIQNESIYPEFKDLKAMIVDDHPATLKVLEQQLQQLGLTVFSASNPLQALKIAEEIALDLIITDESMPDLCGHQLAIKLKKQFPHLCIIGLTADFFAKDKFNHLKENYFDLLLIKPLKLNSLRDAIKTFKFGEYNCIDFKKLIEFTGNDLSARDEILHSLLSIQSECLDSLSNDCFLNNSEQLKALAHKLRGGAELIGAQHLINACKSIETSTNLKLDNQLIAALIEAIQLTNREIESVLSFKEQI